MCHVPSGGRRSLKTQQHAGVVCAVRLRNSPSSRGAPHHTAVQPGSVDVLGPIRLVTAVPRGLGGRAGRVLTDVTVDRGTVVLPRKEVIQPQLPLRLPCYDFTPVTSPTFDGSLPCGLGHRLRVLLTPVV